LETTAKINQPVTIESLQRKIEDYERWFKTLDQQLKSLERERQKLSAVVQYTDAGFLVLDPSLQVVWANQVFIERFGSLANVASILQTQCNQVLCGQTEICATCPARKIFESGRVAHHELHLQMGGEPRHIYATAMPIKSPEGKIEQAIIMLQDITDLEVLRRSEEALKGSETQLRSVLDTVGEGIIVIDTSGNIVMLNQEVQDLFGYQRDELVGKNLQVLMPEKYRSAYAAGMKRYLETGVAKVLEKRLELEGQNKEGLVFPIELRITETRIDSRTLFTAAVRDITERKRREALLAEEKKVLELIGRDASLPEILSFLCRTVEEQSPGALCSVLLLKKDKKTLGCGAAPSLPDSYNKAVDGIAIGPEVGSCGTAAYSGKQVIVTDISADPLWSKCRDLALQHGLRSCWSNPILSVKGEVLGTFAIYHTYPSSPKSGDSELIERATYLAAIAIERRLSDENLRDTLSLHTATLESTADGILVVDEEGKVTSFNQKFIQMWRIPETVMASRDDNLSLAFVLDQLKDPDGFLAKVKELYAQPEAESRDLLEFKDGRVFERYSMPQWLGKKVVGRVWSFRDITERTRLEDQLRQSQKMEAVGQLAGGIAHDFNNLLTAIAGNSEFLLEQLTAGDPRREDVLEIKKASDRAAVLTRQLLAFSRRQMVTPMVLDLNSVVTSMEKMLTRLIGEHISLGTVCRPGLGRVKADPGQIEQIIMNLVVNARDAMPNGGRLTIETGETELDENYAREHAGSKPGCYVMLTVSDTGCGMDAVTQKHIFEPFFTTKEQGKGTGLGLSTVYGIVKQSEGYIWLYSETGIGTTFKVYLPLVEEREPQTGKSPAASAQPFGGAETILLVEDEGSVRTLVGKILRKSGYTVIECPNGKEAVSICKSHSGRIDLLLSDLVMPKMGGPETARQVLSLIPSVKVLFMSGYTNTTKVNLRDLSSMEKTPFLPKPFTQEGLLRKIREVLDAPSGSKTPVQ